MKLTKRSNESYKIGVNEVEGLNEIMTALLRPVQKVLKDRLYWSEAKFEPVEYKSRDGFIPHAHNCGGLELFEVIPKCEEYDFSYFEFGEYNCEENECDESECNCDDEGGLSSSIKIFFKFEGLDDEGKGSFYSVLHGGNDDAPYFRESQNIFEAEFEASSMDELSRKAQKPIGSLIRLIKQG